GASGIVPAGGRCTTQPRVEAAHPGAAAVDFAPSRPGTPAALRLRGRHHRGRGDRAVPTVRQPEPPHGGPHHMLRLQTPLPERYTAASADDLTARIAAAKETLGDRLFVLCHHYQRDESIRFADARGDSFRLSVLAQQRPEAEYIVFCGVHFMAESADILTGDHQAVVLPDLNAGCSMADMADLDEVEEAWAALAE